MRRMREVKMELIAWYQAVDETARRLLDGAAGASDERLTQAVWCMLSIGLEHVLTSEGERVHVWTARSVSTRCANCPAGLEQSRLWPLALLWHGRVYTCGTCERYVCHRCMRDSMDAAGGHTPAKPSKPSKPSKAGRRRGGGLFGDVMCTQ